MGEFTAKDALKISQENDPTVVTKAVEAIIQSVKDAANKGETSVPIRSHGFGTDSRYYNSPQDYPVVGKRIILELKQRGFSAVIRVAERQFVDMWLEVSWGEADSEYSPFERETQPLGLDPDDPADIID